MSTVGQSSSLGAKFLSKFRQKRPYFLVQLQLKNKISKPSTDKKNIRSLNTPSI